jgi:hypothetical protein
LTWLRLYSNRTDRAGRRLEPRMSTRDAVLFYLRAVESYGLDEVARHLHPDVIVVEHPNKISPAGKRYDAAALRAARAQRVGRALRPSSAGSAHVAASASYSARGSSTNTADGSSVAISCASLC